MSRRVPSPEEHPVTLTLDHAYGINVEVERSLRCDDRGCVVYCAGNNVVLMSSADGQQRFLGGSTRARGITAFCLSPDMQWIAMAERGERGCGAIITVYDRHTLLKAKEMVCSASAEATGQNLDCVSLCFSSDGRCLLTQAAAPDWTLECWMWREARLVTKVNVACEIAIAQVSWCPSRDVLEQGAVCALTGPSCFKLFSVTPDDSGFSPMKMQDALPEVEHYSCHAWLRDRQNVIAVGSGSGDIHFFDQGLLVASLSPGVDAKKLPLQLDDTGAPIESGTIAAITSITATKTGFVCGDEGGHVFQYDGGDASIQRTPEHTLVALFTVCPAKPSPIVSIDVGPMTIACSTADRQIHSMALVMPVDTAAIAAAEAAAAAAAAEAEAGEGSGEEGADEEGAGEEATGEGAGEEGAGEEGAAAEAGAEEEGGAEEEARPSTAAVAAAAAAAKLNEQQKPDAQIDASGKFALLHTEFHGLSAAAGGGTALITGMDTCTRRPLVVTCGSDMTVRVWNYMTQKCEVTKVFAEEPLSVALHPSALILLVGFVDKLRMMRVYGNDLEIFREFNIKNCKECSFSNGGQYFAAVQHSTIQLFDTYTQYSATPLETLRGCGKVRSLHWMPGDKHVISASSDGLIYQWDWRVAKREDLMVKKGVQFTSTACDPSGSSVFCAGSDASLKRIGMPNAVLHDNFSYGTVLRKIAVPTGDGRAHPNWMVGTTGSPKLPGSVCLLQLPLRSPDDVDPEDPHAIPPMIEYPALGAPSRRLCLTPDEQRLFVAGDDGILMCFRIENNARIHSQAFMPHSETTLITLTNLDDRKLKIFELETQVEELKRGNELQIKLREMSHQEKIKEVKEKYTQELEQEKNKTELLQDEKNDCAIEFSEKIRTMEDKQQSHLQDLESDFQEQIMREVERYQRLEAQHAVERTQAQTARAGLEARQLDQQVTITADYEARLADHRKRKAKLEEEMKKEQSSCEMQKEQLYEDIEVEIVALQAVLEKQVAKSRDETLQLKGENGVMKKRFSAVQREIEDQHEDIAAMVEKDKLLQGKTSALKSTIAQLRLDVSEKDSQISVREKKIYELKKRNQELEKYKFVLDFEIKELKRQIAPKDTDIAERKDEVKTLDKQLASYDKQNRVLDSKIGELREELDTMQQRILRLRAHKSRMKHTLNSFTIALRWCVDMIQEPTDLDQRVIKLCNDFVPNALQESAVDSEISGEYERQSKFLKESVASLKAAHARLTEKNAAEIQDVMSKNLGLIEEISSLRAELLRIKNARSALKMPGGRASSKRGARDATSKRQGASNATMVLLRQKTAEIAQAKLELQRVESGMRERSTIQVAGRLPPMGSRV